MIREFGSIIKITGRDTENSYKKQKALAQLTETTIFQQAVYVMHPELRPFNIDKFFENNLKLWNEKEWEVTQ